MLRKQYIGKIEVHDTDRTLTAIISTGAVDRDKEVMLPKGADIEQFMTNPIVLWAHEYDGTPIGKATWVAKGIQKIRANMKFAETEKAEEIYQLFKGGFLNAFSIGFLPKDSHSPTPDEIKKKPEWAEAHRIYDKWELLEFSAVPVPANAEALATAVKSKALTVSNELQGELGLEETIYADATEPPVKKEPVKVEQVIETESIVKVEPFRIIRAVPFVDTRAVVNDCIKRAKGIIY